MCVNTHHCTCKAMKDKTTWSEKVHICVTHKLLIVSGVHETTCHVASVCYIYHADVTVFLHCLQLSPLVLSA